MRIQDRLGKNHLESRLGGGKSKEEKEGAKEREEETESGKKRRRYVRRKPYAQLVRDTNVVEGKVAVSWRACVPCWTGRARK